MIRSTALLAVVWLTLSTGGVLSPLGATLAAADSGAFLLDLSARARAPYDDETLSEDERQRRLRLLADESFDVPRMSKFVLGANWRRTTPEQRTEFVAIFAEVNFRRFLPMFTANRTHEFKINEVRQDQKKAQLSFVNSQISRPDGPPIKVVWRVIEEPDGYKILDVVAEGVSMILTLRKEYGTVVSGQGMDALIAQLRSKIETEPVVEPETESPAPAHESSASTQ